MGFDSRLISECWKWNETQSLLDFACRHSLTGFVIVFSFFFFLVGFDWSFSGFFSRVLYYVAQALGSIILAPCLHTRVRRINRFAPYRSNGQWSRKRFWNDPQFHCQLSVKLTFQKKYNHHFISFLSFFRLFLTKFQFSFHTFFHFLLNSLFNIAKIN